MSNTVDGNEFGVAPILFIQSGFPLKISLYIYSTATDSVELYRRRGEVLELSDLVYLRQFPDWKVLSPKEEIQRALAFYDKDPLYSKPGLPD
ncbi:MAG: hypothetical protein NDJ89_02395 [Oligoflexia bacterium]|nr:hypothetical protein [Oligoflexia bacterium]